MFVDRTGTQYGRLVVIKFAGQDYDSCWRSLWLCKCNCGNEIIIRGNSLQSGQTKSCGCLRKELMCKQIGKKSHAYIHGRKTKEILELKEKIRKRDNYKCQECNMTQEGCLTKWSRILDVHHIDGDNINNVPKNMITLCRSCHTIKHNLKGELK